MSTDCIFIDTYHECVDLINTFDMLFVQPYRRIQNLVEAGIAKRQTASVYLKQLAAPGMLSENKVGREKVFIHPNVVRLLTSDDHPVLAYGSTVVADNK